MSPADRLRGPARPGRAMGRAVDGSLDAPAAPPVVRVTVPCLSCGARWELAVPATLEELSTEQCDCGGWLGVLRLAPDVLGVTLAAPPQPTGEHGREADLVPAGARPQAIGALVPRIVPELARKPGGA